MEGLRLDQLAETLREAGIRQAFTPDVSRLTVRLWREIARGGPVSPQRVEQIASALDIPQQTAHEVLQQTALVSSPCPTTGETIRLTITQEGVTSYQPASTVISIVIPQPTKNGLESVEEIWMTFCHHIHFFSSPQAAQEWFAAREQEIVILTIEQAFELGRLTLSEVLRHL